jgi:ubiquinol-cytochrome c reductase cytochrome c1 subunit
MNILLTLVMMLACSLGYAAGGQAELKAEDWSFDGLRGKYDKAELYRGYMVATQVCMACHGFKYISHRDMMRAGFSEAEVKALADAMGKKLDEKLLSGMDAASAQETFGKVPPDLSMMNKARQGGADYVHALLTGYSEDPKEIAKFLPAGVPQGAYFNRVYPGHAIAMSNPLSGPDLVTYADGTKATVEQMSKDVSVFMQWTAEPELVERKRLGVFVLLFVLIFTILAYFTMRVIWKDVKK